ncbi:3-hydroxyacyl-CoA dehydrogenase [Mameliella alba]|uniref:SDR family NAD(P)-dependent oxidoreductase n=1 Tax=Mameliella TaxID=1434019 RepID=UPI0008411C80|nr:MULTISPECIES: SDR family NAD(P)-dependent oxidoreductase [Mameliella]MCR9276114.1 SDR family NAD(P)-dependent oxidoreductase [Paracoccaceae bacterium]ODM47128.1 3-hydroxy-2-methylbutyryl-CoA dehydrogenase [Ruegeria sp. PBVC088]MDD9728988.1 SDR family NAD(P)-dependent oxidoreductase [Mameliella sp. AT18]OWV41002.1 3-hydroxyacyl-CoA dehydrogenase [Mameliella alba]OWV51645.1 3-hydroxyacyl-CoA dehydrogenase [Mameliella alba]
MDITDKVAVVSGGASGLGAATARRLASEGARVGILDFDAERGAAVAAEIGGHAVKTDVGDEASVAAAMSEIVDKLGAPRVAVSCAGIGLAARIVGREGKLSTDLFEKTIRVNLMGTYFVMSYAAREMMALEPEDTGERGVIVNTASIAYQDGQFGQAAYSASKGAIAAMCLPAAREMAKQGVRVMAIAPGLFNTPMMEGLPEDVTAGIVANVPFPHRLGEPAEYAQMVSQIVANPYLNGTTIRLDAAVRLPQR